MTERVRGAVAGLFALLATACIVSGTLGTYTTEATDGEGTTMSGTAPMSTSDPTETSATAGEVCPDGDPGPCASCLAESCCKSLPTCEAGGACTCMFNCFTGGATAPECVTQCGAGVVTMQFSICTVKNCATACSQHSPGGNTSG